MGTIQGNKTQELRRGSGRVIPRSSDALVRLCDSSMVFCADPRAHLSDLKGNYFPDPAVNMQLGLFSPTQTDSGRLRTRERVKVGTTTRRFFRFYALSSSVTTFSAFALSDPFPYWPARFYNQQSRI